MIFNIYINNFVRDFRYCTFIHLSSTCPIAHNTELSQPLHITPHTIIYFSLNSNNVDPNTIEGLIFWPFCNLISFGQQNITFDQKNDLVDLIQNFLHVNILNRVVK